MSGQIDIKALQLENKLLRKILDSLSEGVYATDKHGKIIVYNKAMEQIEDTDRNFVLGYTDEEIYNIFPTENHLRNEVMRTGKALESRRLTYHMASGYKVEMVANAYPYFQDDDFYAMWCTISDVTDVHRLQKQISILTSLLAEENENQKERKVNGAVYTFDKIIGNSEVMRNTIHQAEQIAKSSSNVLIYGETGTGKELFSQSIHNASDFKDGPFVAINCAAIPATLLESQLFGTVKGAFSDAKDMPGFFEQAENGTLFLDEINSMDKGLQAKLLRVLQDKVVCRLGGRTPKKINCRIICATNSNPLDECFKSTFREDLLYRLMTIFLYLPPLREHREDILPLSVYYLEKFNKAYNLKVKGMDEHFTEILMNHSWPGNTRQLVSLLESCVCCLPPQVRILTPEHIPYHLQQQFTATVVKEYNVVQNRSLNDLLSEYEKKIVEDAIKRNNGNVSQAAKSLGISRQNMNYRLNKFNIKVTDLIKE